MPTGRKNGASPSHFLVLSLRIHGAMQAIIHAIIPSAMQAIIGAIIHGAMHAPVTFSCFY